MKNIFGVELMTLKEAAKELGIHVETLRRQRALGYYKDLKFFQPGKHSRPRVMRDSLARCLERMGVAK